MSAPVLDCAAGPDTTVLITGAHLLDPRTGLDGPGDILVREGEIAEIGAPVTIEAPDGAERVDGEGLHALPAFVDPHVHLRTPGREDEEDIDSGSRAAASGGYCQIIAMPNTDPVVDSASILSSLRERARAEARVPTGFTDDGLPVTDAGVLRKALQWQRLAGGVIALHEEDPALSGTGVMHEGPVSALLGMAGIPAISESTMIQRDAAIAGFENARIHIQHLSARESVVAIEQAKAACVQITCEATPHHLVLTDDAVRTLDANFKMNPPLRSEEDRLALIEGLRSGAIDCIATDHAPHSREEKEQPYEVAPMGVTGLETAFAVLHTDLVLPGVLPLTTIVERMTSGTEPFGLRVPKLAKGGPADVVLVDLGAEWEVGESGYESRSANSAFAGRKLTGRVRMTVADGRVAYRERSFAIGAV